MVNSEKYIAIVLFIVGTCSAIYILWIFYFYKVTIKKWNKTKGFIVSNKIMPYDKSGDTGWINEISYQYSINDLDYKSNKLSKNIKFINSFKDDIVINKRYLVGEAVTVFYNPKNYKDAVINPNFDYYNFAALLFGLITFWVASSMW
jgi:hypothetical protein